MADLIFDTCIRFYFGKVHECIIVYYINICQNWVYNTVVSRQLAPIWGYNLSLIRELREYNSTSWLLDIPGFTR